MVGTTTPPDGDMCPYILAPVFRDHEGRWWVPGDRGLGEETSWTEVPQGWVDQQRDDGALEDLASPISASPDHLLVLLHADEPPRWLSREEVRAQFRAIAEHALHEAAACVEADPAAADDHLARASRARGGWWAARLAQYGLLMGDPQEPEASRRHLRSKLEDAGEDLLQSALSELPATLQPYAEHALNAIFWRSRRVRQTPRNVQERAMRCVGRASTHQRPREWAA